MNVTGNSRVVRRFRIKHTLSIQFQLNTNKNTRIEILWTPFKLLIFNKRTKKSGRKKKLTTTNRSKIESNVEPLTSIMYTS